MTQMGQTIRGQSSARHDIFTVLVLVGFIVLTVGVGYIWVKHQQLFGTHPFTVEPAKSSNISSQHVLRR